MIWTLIRRLWPALAIAVAVALAGYFVRGYGANEYRRGKSEVQAQWDMAKAAAERAAIKQQQQQAEQARAASSQYQQEQANAKQQTRIVRETVTQYVDRPVFRDRDCVDDGLRDQLNAAISGSQASAAAR